MRILFMLPMVALAGCLASRMQSMQSLVLPETLLRKMSAGSQMDMPKSRTENFRRFSRSAAAVGILRVHGRA